MTTASVLVLEATTVSTFARRGFLCARVPTAGG
jgi:hypothetical protein